MIVLMLVIPVTAAGVLALARGRVATAVHALATLLMLTSGLTVAARALRGVEATAFGGVLRVDALSGWMIGVIVLVAGLAAAEAPRYAHGSGQRMFYALFHLMVFTLASVFLVNFERSRASLEAAYKYLLICSVGIAIAFVGTVLIYYAEAVRQQGVVEHAAQGLRWTTLLALAPALSPRVLQPAFVFLVIGYGTKAGLAPMHTWLPDAHSEAPAPVSALMSGVLLSVGAYAILRFKPIVDAAAGPLFAARILIVLGVLSLAVAAAFLWNPGNYKRMLAYSSVEHIGLVGLGLGFGGVLGVSGALLHVANHGLAKSVVFLLAGRIRAVYGTVELSGVQGLLRALPVTGRGFLLGVLALMGLPPFGLFTSEVMIFAAGFGAGHVWASAAGLVLLVIAFGGLLRAAHAMLFGPPPHVAPTASGLSAVPMAAALAALVLIGLAWPPGLAAALELATRAIVR